MLQHIILDLFMLKNMPKF